MRSDPDRIGSELAPCHGRATQALVGISIGEVEDKPEPKPVDEKTQPPYCLRPSRAERGSPVGREFSPRATRHRLTWARSKKANLASRPSTTREGTSLLSASNSRPRPISPIFAQKMLCTRNYRYDPAVRPPTFSHNNQWRSQIARGWHRFSVSSQPGRILKTGLQRRFLSSCRLADGVARACRIA
jgi:hypothetical protein